MQHLFEVCMGIRVEVSARDTLIGKYSYSVSGRIGLCGSVVLHVFVYRKFATQRSERVERQ